MGLLLFRDTGEDNHEEIVHYKMLYNQMITEIMNTCRVVNQVSLISIIVDNHPFLNIIWCMLNCGTCVHKC